ncbi:TPA: hypothetical protein NJ499_001539 [Vibrio parahaemolyticus]|nr:hypothetical protein [Vibrio parahaemolyticus]
MTQNIEQRTLTATTTLESSAKTVDEIAHQDKDVSTPVGQRKSFPKLSREIEEDYNTRASQYFDIDRIGDFSLVVGLELTEEDRQKAWEYPDGSGDWYSPKRTKLPFVAGNAPTTEFWALVSGVSLIQNALSLIAQYGLEPNTPPVVNNTDDILEGKAACTVSASGKLEVWNRQSSVLSRKKINFGYLNVDDFYPDGILPGFDAVQDTEAFKKCFQACQMLGKMMQAGSPSYLINDHIGDIQVNGFYIRFSGEQITTIYNKIPAAVLEEPYMFTVKTGNVISLRFGEFTFDGTGNLDGGGFLKCRNPSPSQTHSPQSVKFDDVTLKNNITKIPLIDADSGLNWHFGFFSATSNSNVGQLDNLQNVSANKITLTDNSTGLMFTNIQYFEGGNVVSHRNGSSTHGGLCFIDGQSITLRAGKCKGKWLGKPQIYCERINTVNVIGLMLFGDVEIYAHFKNCGLINIDGVEIYPVANANKLRGVVFENSDGYQGCTVNINIMFRMQGGCDFSSLFHCIGPNKISTFNLSGYIGSQIKLSADSVVDELIGGANYIENLLIDGLTVQARDDDTGTLSISSFGNTAACRFVSEEGLNVIGSNAVNIPRHFDRPTFSNSVCLSQDGLALRGNVGSTFLGDIKGYSGEVLGFSIPPSDVVIKTLTVSGGVVPGSSFCIASVSFDGIAPLIVTARVVSQNKITIHYMNNSTDSLTIPAHTVKVLLMNAFEDMYAGVISQ